ncbi:MAG: hypothetical protein ACXV3F_14065 [Frankiaceae bacterium]
MAARSSVANREGSYSSADIGELWNDMVNTGRDCSPEDYQLYRETGRFDHIVRKAMGGGEPDAGNVRLPVGSREEQARCPDGVQIWIGAARRRLPLRPLEKTR